VSLIKPLLVKALIRGCRPLELLVASSLIVSMALPPLFIASSLLTLANGFRLTSIPYTVENYLGYVEGYEATVSCVNNALLNSILGHGINASSGVVLPSSLAGLIGVSVGGRVTLVYGGRVVESSVIGVYDSQVPRVYYVDESCPGGLVNPAQEASRATLVEVNDLAGLWLVVNLAVYVVVYVLILLKNKGYMAGSLRVLYELGSPSIQVYAGMAVASLLIPVASVVAGFSISVVVMHIASTVVAMLGLPVLKPFIDPSTLGYVSILYITPSSIILYSIQAWVYRGLGSG